MDGKVHLHEPVGPYEKRFFDEPITKAKSVVLPDEA